MGRLDRKLEPEAGTATTRPGALPRHEGKIASVRVGDPLRHGETEPRSRRFGGEERLEDLLRHIGFDPRPGVRNLYAHRAKVVLGPHCDAPSFSELFTRIRNQSVDDLGNEIRICGQLRNIGIDLALGTGGLPRGRIVEVFGPEASGKTTLALQVIAQEHRNGGVCAFIDAEHALDVSYAKALGVNPDQLLISQPDNGEQALEICEMLVRSGGVSLVVIDSVAAPATAGEGE